MSDFEYILIKNMEGGRDISTSPSFFPWLLRVSMLLVKRDLGFFVHHIIYILKTFENMYIIQGLTIGNMGQTLGYP